MDEPVDGAPGPPAVDGAIDGAPGPPAAPWPAELASAPPHWAQKRFPGSEGAPQCGQETPSGAPQSAQKRSPTLRSPPHDTHHGMRAIVRDRCDTDRWAVTGGR